MRGTLRYPKLRYLGIVAIPLISVSSQQAALTNHSTGAIESQKQAGHESKRLKPRPSGETIEIKAKEYRFSDHRLLTVDERKFKELRGIYHPLYCGSMTLATILSLGLLLRRNWLSAAFFTPIWMVIGYNSMNMYQNSIFGVTLSEKRDTITVEKGLISLQKEVIPVASLQPSPENMSGTTLLSFSGRTLKPDSTERTTTLQLPLDDIKSGLLHAENMDFLLDVLSGKVSEVQQYRVEVNQIK